MAAWQVKLERFPPEALEHFSRVWRKHDHGRTEESISQALRDLTSGRAEAPVIAEYSQQETAERVLAEIENLSGEGTLVEVPAP